MAVSAMISNANIDFKLKMTEIDISNKYSELNNNYENFKSRLLEIGNIESGDKLARDNNKVYFLHKKNEWFLQARRWWGNQGRKFTFKHLDEDFTEYMKFLDKILGSLIFSLDARYINLAKKVRELSDSIMSGLYKLKSTYPEEKELICKIDSIILAIIDYKSSVSEKLNVKRVRAFSD
jgi:hypothetical protein